ncbi:hypothetical protein [Bradyrhizobium elkanii]|uniref:Uncharacterized protein n=1 Tax=Bradyrhizobium elkanii TaxID=29448 RepID=A0A8I2C7Q2_BRAEL|nr:hypothetical protein [Bradyrhizobium elkanii]MBP1297563.1 hypothetical protein [Bradyrhizobium elkanii]MCP1931783.1 hypothetical protein [Bradyrhizobium elkanii]MCS3577673.1 hypothetical protein [Bradyrhizobium elkanii]MCS3720548.1 hypothetical protein [Bradyrhizobium elkanii]MCS4004965.1 hypothetical protein [Bradyrhizobium elkanii USDA 61]
MTDKVRLSIRYFTNAARQAAGSNPRVAFEEICKAIEQLEDEIHELRTAAPPKAGQN